MKQKKYKSFTLWVAIFSLLGLVLKSIFKVEIDNFDTIVNTILVVLAGLGIINNPEVPNRF